MGQVIHVKKARQDHRCEASMIVIRAWGKYFWDAPKLTINEQNDLIKASGNEFNIKENEPYIRYKYRDGIKLFEIRAIQAIHDICVKYKLYPDND